MHRYIGAYYICEPTINSQRNPYCCLILFFDSGANLFLVQSLMLSEVASSSIKAWWPCPRKFTNKPQKTSHLLCRYLLEGSSAPDQGVEC
ncbi:hypothetical protein A359_08390 [secondary endosymbiont of Ctenarytaina eucalypti]|uniref:Uncharacterized protein n=1 Tax=secondary endosymbiont of Ctenarytaina eucalypti TaxID=1199245 RepID=J3TY12_9ENTR|nr:hypothetical protein A359_08390 [secondary endosymbiont of Ctenarytaina eucalypti]